jgi:hypothetical protein
MAFQATGPFDVEEAELEARVLRVRSLWLSRWPDHCRICHGAGGDYAVENDVTHPCRCLLDGKCPRCAAATNPLAALARWNCASCKWTLNQNEAYGSEDDAHCP